MAEDTNKPEGCTTTNQALTKSINLNKRLVKMATQNTTTTRYFGHYSRAKRAIRRIQREKAAPASVQAAPAPTASPATHPVSASKKAQLAALMSSIEAERAAA